MTPKHALKFVDKLVWAKSLLVIHGILSDSERDKANKRIDQWAIKHGLRRKP